MQYIQEFDCIGKRNRYVWLRLDGKVDIVTAEKSGLLPIVGESITLVLFAGTQRPDRMRRIPRPKRGFGDRDGAKRSVRVFSFYLARAGRRQSYSSYQRPLHARQGGAAL